MDVEPSDKQLLIVEDDMLLSMVIVRMVESMGFEVLDQVKSGEEALRAALENKPDLILMDIRLDGQLDGIETVQHIHSSSDIPVIYITGNNDTHTRQRAEQTNYVDFIVKPLDRNTLSRALDKTNLQAFSTDC